MNVFKEVAAVAVGAAAAALCFAATAGADPLDDPCQLHATFLCEFAPIAPTLDHDIDLTQSAATINGQPLPQLPAAVEPVPPPSS